MNFNITHMRGVEGSDVQVGITSTAPETIASVTVVLDGDELEEVQMPDATETYTRAFLTVGSAGPQFEHLLEVTAMDQNGAPHRSVTGWTDLN